MTALPAPAVMFSLPLFGAGIGAGASAPFKLLIDPGPVSGSLTDTAADGPFLVNRHAVLYSR